MRRSIRLASSKVTLDFDQLVANHVHRPSESRQNLFQPGDIGIGVSIEPRVMVYGPVVIAGTDQLEVEAIDPAAVAEHDLRDLLLLLYCGSHAKPSVA